MSFSNSTLKFSFYSFKKDQNHENIVLNPNVINVLRANKIYIFNTYMASPSVCLQKRYAHITLAAGKKIKNKNKEEKEMKKGKGKNCIQTR